MKYAISILLVSTILFASLQKTLVFTFYEMEKEYVIEKLCINKDVPGSCCKGKCFIEKQTSEKEAEGIIINVLKNVKEEFFFDYADLNQNLNSNTIQQTYYYNVLNTSTFNNSIFHPPSVS